MRGFPATSEFPSPGRYPYQDVLAPSTQYDPDSSLYPGRPRPLQGVGGEGRSWFSVTITSERVGEIIEHGLEGGARPIWGPIVRPRRKFEKRISASVQAPTEIKVTASIHVAKPVIYSFSCSTRIMKPVTFSFSGQREPAHRWIQAIQEDENLLFGLYSR